ncbi:PPE family protein [Nocardia sp. NBC_01730]|uniref:PPE family protein n=1 Tax=Nocardia sp. NBC_01730 TaxID=2975998 RepID=UPI002E131756|nr:PPE family protein [Nocardia sp. NBC_01730]
MFYAAYPPEVNSARLTFGLGPGPMVAAAAGYAAIGDGLLAAATAAEGQTTAMGIEWQGDSANQAQLAFRKHASWLREQGTIAMAVAQHALVQAEAYTSALGKMPPLPAILANRALTATLVASNSMGQNTPMIAVNEMVYMVMWAQAAGTMYQYHAETLANTASLPPPPPAPEIVGPSPTGPGPGFKSSPDVSSVGHTDPTGPTVTQNNPVQHDNSVTQDTSNTTGDNTTDTPTQPDQPPADSVGNTPPEVQEPVSDPMQGLTDAPYGSEGLIDGTAQDAGFFGTSASSSTLVGLNGGAGAALAIGLQRGGLGSIPGGSTGFRMPTNWSLGKGTAFGASLNNNATAASPARKGPPRGAIAPKTGRRRRDDEKSTKPAAVFVPGEPQEVPVLEKPPVIGVIEYVDEPEPRLDDSDAQLANILGETDRGKINAS